MKRLLVLLLLLSACDNRGLNPNEGVAVGNPGNGKLTVGGSQGLAMTSARASAGTLRMEPCDGGVDVIVLPDPVDLLEDPGAEIPTGTYCGLELSVTSLEVAGDGFAMSLDLPAVRFAADSLLVDDTQLTLQLGEDGWLTDSIVALADDPEAIGPGSVVHDLLVARLLHGTGLDSSGEGEDPVHQPDPDRRFVAVGLDGALMVSRDAENWTWELMGGESLYDITWGEGLWVAVGGEDGPRLVISADGEQWQDVNVPGEDYLKAVTWAEGRFVAVGVHDTRLYSDDGVRWWPASTPSSDYTRGVAWGNGVYVGVGEINGDGTRNASPDGEVWGGIQQDVGAPFYDVHFADGHFVMVGMDGRRTVSTDGVDVVSEITEGEKLRGITFGDGRWVGVGYSRAVFSDDLEQWGESSGLPDLLEVTYGAGHFVATGEFGELLWSEDAESWSEVYSGEGYGLYGIAYGPE